MTDSQTERPVDAAGPDDTSLEPNVGVELPPEGSGRRLWALPDLGEDKLRLDLETVVDAAERLRAANLGRSNASFVRWLLRKRCGLAVSEPSDPETSSDAIITTEACYHFARSFFGIWSESLEPYYNPFIGQTLGAPNATTDWAIQVLYTQIGRRNQREQTIFSQPEEIENAVGDSSLGGRAPRVTWRSGVNSVSAYWASLPSLLGDRRVPLEPAAVWRYRYEALDPETLVSDLTDRFVEEYSISPTELSALFTATSDTTNSPSEAETSSEGRRTNAD